MSFFLRAFLVVSVLTYLASSREIARTAGISAPAPVPATMDAVPAAWQSVPAATRDRILREGAAGLAGRLAAGPSRDTLGDSDRHLSWRGVPAP